MKKKKIAFALIILILLVLSAVSIHFYKIATAKVEVKLKSTRNIEVYSKVYLSELITSINGKLMEDKLLQTDILGNHEYKFYYINDDNIKVSYILNYNVQDTTPPIIGVPSTFSVTKGYEANLSSEFFCGDNYDDNPKCTIEGEYDLNQEGEYNLIYKAKDKSNNETTQKFKLIVQEKKNSSNSSNNANIKTRNFLDIKEKYKEKNTKIGIDVSRWQGNIDFKKVKEAGVEFVMIRVGSENSDGEYFVDPKFEEYMNGFIKEKIPVGIYYYSYASSKEAAVKEAKWVIKQIQKYEIKLPVVFDWENWKRFHEYKVSFHTLSEIAEAFLDTVEKSGYQGMLYSSKYYLENIWFKTNHKIWLAHYTEKTDYKGDYYIWQLCSNGKIDGINDNVVDVDILYKNNTIIQ